MLRVHFIAIGGAAMHNLAIAQKEKGFQVTGSDDNIFEPSLSRLKRYDILPKQFGWFPEKIDATIDTIILGMHARPDNPELLKARELGLNIVSYPEFLYQQTCNKKRIVVAGSHGKTTTTAMILHVLKDLNFKFDYMVGSHIDGFENMVGLSHDSQIAIFEGDEYLSSPIDRRSKFLWYQPDIAILTGIEWDHINVFPTMELYIDTFKQFMETMPANGKLFWFKNDIEIQKLIKTTKIKSSEYQYEGLEWIKESNGSIVKYNNQRFNSKLFGDHNFQNLNAALQVCLELGIEAAPFFESMQNFKGADRRLQLIKESSNPIFYDFAHAPSKVRATVAAVRKSYPDKKIVACYELHTFSSLNKDFLEHYQATLDKADVAYVYFNPEVIKHKKMEALDKKFVSKCFNHNNITISTDNTVLFQEIEKEWNNGAVILLMSSGNFGGINPVKWANQLQNP